MTARPFSQACENNKRPILQVLQEVLATAKEVLELGSGTGQHARFFAGQLPHLRWRPTDLEENLAGIRGWAEEYRGDNLLRPLALDVRDETWPAPVKDAIFTANSLHIMVWSAVQTLFSYLGQHAPSGNLLVVYGPFNYAGKYTSASNANFDRWLAARDPDSAIRDFEAVDQLAISAGYRLQADYPMPANNRTLVWRKPVPVGTKQ